MFLTLMMMSGGSNETVYLSAIQKDTFGQNLKKIKRCRVWDYFATFLLIFYWVAKIWSATMKNPLISTSEVVLYGDISILNRKRQKNTKENSQKKEKNQEAWSQAFQCSPAGIKTRLRVTLHMHFMNSVKLVFHVRADLTYRLGRKK